MKAFSTPGLESFLPTLLTHSNQHLRLVLWQAFCSLVTPCQIRNPQSHIPLLFVHRLRPLQGHLLRFLTW
ncbi:uncharacterized protein LACBIDRAFT_299394 [Laccaria bicolor S238N-H82]|uniref:Predicted protein n=1 Tax=Laccaria bicolor (strain S238N-H82 / ATCC MYA-4686) TaxID=486041 RepID=B0DEM4_LACBS|nr:uncharacterized protein LACBIDRAFT_299394 [Laccaria bicolor S238N-H82]EDR07057.1 predicted protein [Laccaria bicolor S238N-H82]|eukprot:XP_001882430.1 predicted protein [Laccaria bicolor S238N-H82]